MKPGRVWAALILLAPSVGYSSELAGIATIVDRTTHRASSYDRTGGNEDAVGSFAPDSTRVLLDTDGPGCVTHLWMTLAIFPNHTTVLRDLVIRAYWEHAGVPSVEVPLGDFFALGHAKRYPVQSVPIAVGGNPKALNCYWPMPFYRHARIEIYNAGSRSVRKLYYHVDYELGTIPPDQGLFHAAYHRERELRSQGQKPNTTGADNYVILNTTGEGQYVGCVLSVDAQPGGWWGEGDDMIFVDDAEEPTIIGTGSEDYFSNAWGYDAPFSYPYYGAPLVEKRPDGGSFTTVYRWHIADPIRFHKRIRVTIEHLFSKTAVNDYASVAYWYQREPVTRRESLPRGEANHPRIYGATTRPAVFDMSGTELEAELRSRGIAATSITTNVHDGYKSGGWLRIEVPRAPIEIRIPVPEDGTYRVALKPVNYLAERPIRLSLKGGQERTFEKLSKAQRNVPSVDIGTGRSENRTLTVVIDGGPVIGIDSVHIEKVDS